MAIFLGIETSCDDTSISLVKPDGEVLQLHKYTSDEDHRPFGGIVPERASRNHLKSIAGLLEELNIDFKSLAGVGYTSRPGLVGSPYRWHCSSKNTFSSLQIASVSCESFRGTYS